MKLPVILDVAISLVLIFFLFSTVVSLVNELLSQMVNSRGDTLRKHLVKWLDEQPLTIDAQGEREGEESLVEALYKEPEIQARDSPKMMRLPRASNKPSYISATDFYYVLMRILGKAALTDHYVPKNLADIEETLEKLPDGRVKVRLLSMLQEVREAGGKLVDFRERVEAWFNDYMASVSIIYKRHVKNILALLSVLLVLTFNLDSIVMFEHFWKYPDYRAIAVSMAEESVQEDANQSVLLEVESTASTSDTLAGEPAPEAMATSKDDNERHTVDYKLIRNIEQLDTVFAVLDKTKLFALPIFWSKMEMGTKAEKPKLGKQIKYALMQGRSGWDSFSVWEFVGYLLLKCIGLAITVFCLTMGAPFWFDVMKKLVALRPK